MTECVDIVEGEEYFDLCIINRSEDLDLQDLLTCYCLESKMPVISLVLDPISSKKYEGYKHAVVQLPLDLKKLTNVTDELLGEGNDGKAT